MDIDKIFNELLRLGKDEGLMPDKKSLRLDLLRADVEDILNEAIEERYYASDVASNIGDILYAWNNANDEHFYAEMARILIGGGYPKHED